MFLTVRSQGIIYLKFTFFLANGLPDRQPRARPQERRPKIQTQDSNLWPMDYVSTALPTELVWIVFRMPNFSYLFPAILPLLWYDNVMFLTVRS